MRTLVRTIFSFLVSILTGACVVQFLAVQTGGQEEFIPLFVLPALVALVVCVLFLIARLRPDPVRAAGRVAKVLLALLALGLAGLIVLFLVAEGPETLMSDGVILVGIFVPAMVVVLTQWLMFGRRQVEQPVRFGRGAS